MLLWPLRLKPSLAPRDVARIANLEGVGVLRAANVG